MENLGGDDATVRLWDASTGREHTRFTDHAGTVRSVAFSPDGTILANGGDDATVRLWKAAVGEQGSQLTGHSGMVWSVAFSPDGTTLASGSADSKVWVWAADTGDQRSQLTGHAGSTRSKGCSGPGRHPVSSSTSLAALSTGFSPASILPIGISQPCDPVMKRCRHSSRTRRWSSTTTAPAPGG